MPRVIPGRLLERLRDEMIAAFPDRREFEQFTRFRLDRSLSADAGDNRMKDAAFRLLEALEAENGLDGLVAELIAARSKRPEAREIARLLAACEAAEQAPPHIDVTAPDARPERPGGAAPRRSSVEPRPGAAHRGHGCVDARRALPRAVPRPQRR